MSLPALARLQSIDVLRGLGALAVVCVHVPHAGPGPGDPADPRYWLLLPADFGFLGLMLFIVLSGFCLHANALREAAAGSPGAFAVDWGRFWRRRFTRLYPPYLVTVLLCALAILGLGMAGGGRGLFADYFADGAPTARLGVDVLLHAGLVHNLVAGFELSLGNLPLWSLGMETQLYALFMLYLALRRRLPRAAVVGGVLLVSGVVWPLWIAWGPRAAGLGPVAAGDWHWHPLGWWGGWILGTVSAEAFAGHLRLPRWCTDARVGAGLLLAYVASHSFVLEPLTGQGRPDQLLAAHLGLAGPAGLALQAVLIPLQRFLSPLACFVLVNAAVRAELANGPWAGRSARALAAVGVFSYSLYLTHMPILAAFERALGLGGRFDLPSILLRYAVLLPATLAVGYGFFRLVERPCLTKRPPAAPDAAPVEPADTIEAAHQPA